MLCEFSGRVGFASSEAVGQLFSEPERFGFIDSTHQVPHAARTSLLQHQPAGALSSGLLLRPLFCPFPLQPPEDRKRMEMKKP